MITLNLEGRKELADLLSRARAALETPNDITTTDKKYLISDLSVAEDRLRP